MEKRRPNWQAWVWRVSIPVPYTENGGGFQTQPDSSERRDSRGLRREGAAEAAPGLLLLGGRQVHGRAHDSQAAAQHPWRACEDWCSLRVPLHPPKQPEQEERTTTKVKCHAFPDGKRADERDDPQIDGSCVCEA